MIIKIVMRCPQNDSGAHWRYETESELSIDQLDEAELFGREFATLVEKVEAGMVAAQKVAYGSGDED